MPYSLRSLLGALLLAVSCAAPPPQHAPPPQPPPSLQPTPEPKPEPEPTPTATPPNPLRQNDGYRFVAWGGTVQRLTPNERNRGRDWIILPDGDNHPLCLLETRPDGAPWTLGQHLYFTGRRGPVRRSWQPCDPLEITALSKDPDDPALFPPPNTPPDP